MTRDYYGTKRVTAWPEVKPYDKNNTEGYAVKYPDGYISWSPKDVFEKAYQPLDALSFGHALQALKEGRRVARAGWNGKGMFLFFNPGSQVKVSEGRPLAASFPVGTECKMLPYIMMKTASEDLQFVPWLASQTDMLADDWMVLGEY